MTTAAGPAPGPFDPPAATDAGTAGHDRAATHLVLRNDRAEHSLWPAHLETPGGWRQVRGPSSYEECAAHIERAAATP
ncbi:MbtH family NRPS accessory protein [Streptomyces monticola]|uniref:MbtH family NRPS accessory protein n=1 Tax=Streptomyces monticola TaxID=2666263 RepID=A0ABW2JAV1_9ACTN